MTTYYSAPEPDDLRWDPMSGQPPRYRHTQEGMVLDPEGAYLLAHMCPPLATPDRADPERRAEGLEAGPGWWHPEACIDRHDDDHNCLDAGGSIIGWRDPIVSARLAVDEPLDVAWREAEAALPYRGDRRKSWRLVLSDNGKGTYVAEYLPPFMPYDDWMDAKHEAFGDTPAEALRNLAVALTPPPAGKAVQTANELEEGK